MFVLEWHRCLQDVLLFKMHFKSMNEQARQQMLAWSRLHVFDKIAYNVDKLTGIWSMTPNKTQSEVVCERMQRWNVYNPGKFSSVDIAGLWGHANAVYRYTDSTDLETKQSQHKAASFANDVLNGKLEVLTVPKPRSK